MPKDVHEDLHEQAGREHLLQRIQQLEERLEESEETLRALRGGEVDAIVVAGRDGDNIYTLKGADEAYRRIVESMTEGALTLTVDGLILFSNERFAALVGMPLDRVMGSFLDAFVAADDEHVLAALRSPVLRTGKAEVNLWVTGGVRIPAYLSWQRVNQDDLECISVVVTDLSEQKRNAAIVADEQLARSILEQASEAIIVTDLNGKIIRASRAADKLAGFPVFHHHFDDVFRIRLSGKKYPFQEALTGLRSSAPVERVEAKAVTRDHRAMQMLFTAARLADAEGRLLGCIITLIDVTERKKAEDALRASNEDLEQFAFAASHDLQEPLRMITSYSQLLIRNYRGALDEETAMSVRFVTEGARRMRDLLADLLAFTHMGENGASQAGLIDLNDIFQKTMENCRIAIEETGATVTSDPLPSVRGYEPHLVGLFQNLIGNALKYRGKGAPRIHVSSEILDGAYRVTVADNGMGIDPQYHDSIFGVFKRLHGREIPGTGMGLAICKRVMERTGGRIWVESRLNEGATFYCDFPAT